MKKSTNSIQDVLILSNGPGEVSTWVRPVVRSLRKVHKQKEQKIHDSHDIGHGISHPIGTPDNPPQLNLRISVVLSPCSHAMGTERRVVAGFPEVDRVQGPEHFWPFLLGGKTAEKWDWSDRGVVIFLGGDQFFSVVIGRRLGYRILTYAEREVRWLSWIDGAAIAHPTLTATGQPPSQVQSQAQSHSPKIRWVGDLMVDAAQTPLPNALTSQRLLQLTQAPNSEETLAPQSSSAPIQWVGLLPGSKAAKLMQGVPLVLATAEELVRSRPQVRCIIPVAPTLTLEELARYGDRIANPLLEKLGNIAARLVIPSIPFPNALPYLETEKGVKIYLWQRSPAYDLLQQCTVCLTTVGANTAELAALATPMVVILPTQQLDAMRAWDGLPGLLAQLPGLGPLIARLINQQALKRIGLLAWPNIWAQDALVPELVGTLTPSDLVKALLPWLCDSNQNQNLRDRLRQVCGAPGAAQKVAQWTYELLRNDQG